jgi:hypothetical protein
MIITAAVNRTTDDEINYLNTACPPRSNIKLKTLPNGPIVGVYLLTFPDGTQYVGSSMDVRARINMHYTSSKSSTPCNREGYNPNEMKAELLCQCRPAHREHLETLFIFLLKPEHNYRHPIHKRFLEWKNYKPRKESAENVFSNDDELIKFCDIILDDSFC